MEEYRDGMPVVRRKAVLMGLDNLSMVIDVVLPCDPGNHMAPRWNKTISLGTRQFEFVRDAHEPQKRPIYREIPETEPQSTQEFTIEDYKDMHAYHEDMIRVMAQLILTANPQLKNTENVIKLVMQSIEKSKQQQ